MSNHLSPDQFAKGIAGRLTDGELRHVGQCLECRGELERFDKTLSLLRSAIRHRVDHRIASQAPGVSLFPIRSAPASVPKRRWAWIAAAALVLTVIPFFTGGKKPPAVVEKTSAAADAEALMRAVNLHLSRTVPAPLEPLMMSIQSDESSQSGGVQ